MWKTSPPSRASGVKASLNLFVSLLLPLCPKEHFLGATRQRQHQGFLPHCVTMTWEQQLLHWSQREIAVTIHNCGFSSVLCPQPAWLVGRWARKRGVSQEREMPGERTSHSEEDEHDDHDALTHLALVPLQSGISSTPGEPSSPARVNRVYKIDCDFSNSV